MQKFVKRNIMILAAVGLLSACSSGGGSTPAPPANASATVSGTAVSTSGVSASAAAIKAASETPLVGAKVTILSYDTTGTLKQTVETVTQTGGGFTADVTALAGGGTISVKIEKQDGNQKYVAFEKSFKYATASELAAGLLVQAKLDPVLVRATSVTPDFDPVAAKAAATNDIFSIAIIQDSRGVKSVVTNSKISAAKAAGQEVTWQLDVAKSVLKANGTTELTMQAQNYNPAEPSQMTRFPAEQTDTGDKLISARFDFIDIKDQDDKALTITKKAAATARKTAALAYAIKQRIPDCSLILKDENTTKPGVQIGFYFMRNGAWNKLGEATLYKDLGSATTDPVLFEDEDIKSKSCSNSTRPYAIITDADINKDLDFDYRWFNLDYVAFGDIKTACIEGSFEQNKGGSTSPLGGFGIDLTDLKNNGTRVTGFQSAYGNVKNDGTYRLEFAYTAESVGTPTATFNYYDPVSWQQGNMNQVLGAKNANDCYTIAKKTITAPACSVTGKVLKADGTPAVNRSVQIYDRYSYSGNRWVYTNNAGIYESQVQCENDYSLTVDGISKVFNVNGTVTTDEQTDASNLVTMKDISKSNQKPTAYLNSGNTNVLVNNKVNLYGYGYDPDGDNLTYAWTTTCGTLSAATGSNVVWTAPATAPAGNTCTVSLTATDGALTSDPKTVSIDVRNSSGERPPIISSMYVPSTLTSAQSANLNVYAYDYDSATLNYNWTATCGTLANPTTTAPTWTAPTVLGTSTQSCTLTVTVSDGTTPVTRQGTVSVLPNRPPSISGVTVPTSAALSATLNLLASAYDPNGDAMTWAWSIISGGGTLGNGCSGSATAGSAVNSTCSYNAPASETSVTVRFSVNDGANPAVTVDKTIAVSNASGSTDVIVQ